MSAPTAPLVVAMYGRRVGAIERSGPRLTFRYDDAYAADLQATPLSLSMPVSQTEYTSRFVEAHLRGLLPDHSDVRQRWASHFGLKDRDTFGLIRAIGADCAGGAMFVDEARLEDAIAGAGTVEPYDERQIADRLRRLRADDGDWLEDDEHWSLAGGQGKFTLARLGEGWGRATGFAPSTHILKPGISRLPAQALTEHVSQRACRLIGLRAAESAYVEFEDQPAIVIERFDRRRDASGRIVRVHQEDMCQAFALDPSKKYPSDGGPGVPQIAQLLSAVDESSPRRFAQVVIANYLLGAPDAHAKNYSVLLAGRAAQLAPMYDVASGLFSSPTGRLRYAKAAMSIGGENRFGEVESQHWEKFARACHLGEQDVRTMVRRAAGALPDALASAIAELPTATQQLAVVRDQVLPRVAALCEITKAGLDATRRVDGRVVRPAIAELEQIGTPAPLAQQVNTDGPQDRVAPGTPAAGQWTTRKHSEPEVFLRGED
jgi:serine/threonine-protein kinase HipA